MSCSIRSTSKQAAAIAIVSLSIAGISWAGQPETTFLHSELVSKCNYYSIASCVATEGKRYCATVPNAHVRCALAPMASAWFTRATTATKPTMSCSSVPPVIRITIVRLIAKDHTMCVRCFGAPQQYVKLTI